MNQHNNIEYNNKHNKTAMNLHSCYVLSLSKDFSFSKLIPNNKNKAHNNINK